ncbi:unnamed protein product, partial [Closterium sp. NIES-53]
MTLRPSTAPQRVPLPSLTSSLPAGPDPASDSLRAASPAVTRFLATAVTDPLFESTAASALVTELVDFATACRLDYTTSIVAESASASVCPPSVGGECALGTDVLENRQEEFECFAASVPHLVSMLIAPEGDPDAPHIPTSRSYAEAIEDEVPPPGANIVSGMWIFRVKRPPGSPPAFKARYVARGFSQRQGVDFFQTFSPTPKMTTLRILLHIAAQRDYKLHSLDFSTAFLQGSLHEEIWLRRPPGFTGSFPAGTQWSLRRPVYGLRQAPHEWHDTLRTTLAVLGFAPSTSDPSLFLRTDTTLLPFYVLVYVGGVTSVHPPRRSRGARPTGPPSGTTSVRSPRTSVRLVVTRPVTRFLATAVTDPLFESTAVSALVTELVDFATACRLDYTTSIVAESASASVCPPSVGGECALGTDVLENRQEEFECFAASVPHLVSMLIAPEGDPDAPHIPTSRSYAEAIEGPYSSQWQAAMDAEMASWKSTGTYVDEVPPPGANIVSGMWIFRVKRPPGSPPAFKARYVARGFSQRQGVDFFQTFSPTPKMTTLRILLHIAAQRDYKLHSLDFSTAFLQGSLHEEIWLRRPPGFTGSFPAGTQWSLRRPVYGLRQAPREWHDTLRTTLAVLGFAPSTSDPSLFLRTDTTLLPFYVLVYVGDLVFATADTEALAHVKSKLQKRHTCTDLAPPSDESVEPSGPYPELVGCLMYLMTCTRPDLAYPLSFLARYVAPGRHRKVHWDAAKRVLRYLCSRSGMGLVLGGRARVVLTGHADASWVDDLATQRSSQGYTFSLGSGSISWRSTCSSSVLSSSCEAEIYAGAMAAQDLRWLTYLLTDLGEAPRSPPVLYVDNKAMLALCQEHRQEHRTKHIALRYFLARELQQRGQLHLAYVASQANTADVFTKALQPCDHQPCFVFLDWSCDLLFSPTLRMGGRVCTHWLLSLLRSLPLLATSAQVSASGQVAASCSCRLLSHQTLLWHHRLGHPSLPRLRGMHSRLLVSGLPRSLPPLPPSPAPPCLPCVEGQQCAAPQSSSPPTTSPLQTLHIDVWGPARVSRQGREQYFLLVVDDYTRCTTVFPLRSKGEVFAVLIPWIHTVRLQLRERFGQDQPVLRLHSERGGEFSSDFLREFCRGEGITQSFTLPDSPQQNGIAKHRIGLVVKVARTSMIHAAAPHFLWLFAVRYVAHQLNLWP